MDFEDVQNADDLERVSAEVVWQNFERLVAFIFERNDFQVGTGKVMTKSKKRRQFDVIAKKNGKTFLAECKKWAGNRYRLSALKTAAKKHNERLEFYKSITGENAIPIIVTLIEEEILCCDGVPIVPILKLNSFINEYDKGFNLPDLQAP